MSIPTNIAGKEELPDMTATVPPKQGETSLSKGHKETFVAGSDSQPLRFEDERESDRNWLDKFFKKLPLRELLALATAARKDGRHDCRFGHRFLGGFNVIIFLVFDDGRECVAKLLRIPSIYKARDEDEILKSECATLFFLEGLETVPTPKVYGWSFDMNNTVKSPYILMEKMPGVNLYQAVHDRLLDKSGVHKSIQQLGQIMRDVNARPFGQIGSLTVPRNSERGYRVDKQLSLWSDDDPTKDPPFEGPHRTSMMYYATLLHNSWKDWEMQNRYTGKPKGVRQQLQIHALLASILFTYIKRRSSPDKFYLRHTDLSTGNILVDPTSGAITGIIDWEYAGTYPPEAAENYPLFLQKDKFVKHFKEVYDDPLAELQGWRTCYAKSLEGDAELEECLFNVDARITFEDILRERAPENNENATIEQLVELGKVLRSHTAMEQLVPLDQSGSSSKKVRNAGVSDEGIKERS
jgi:aminoglycoside phosphotransferase (APT) family kinase protein